MPHIPAKMPRRAVLYPQDVMNIMGARQRTAYRLMEKVRAAYGKPKHAYITVLEFSAYTGIPVETIQQYLLD